MHDRRAFSNDMWQCMKSRMFCYHPFLILHHIVIIIVMITIVFNHWNFCYHHHNQITLLWIHHLTISTIFKYILFLLSFSYKSCYNYYRCFGWYYYFDGVLAVSTIFAIDSKTIWGQHWAHLGPTGPRWAPYMPPRILLSGIVLSPLATTLILMVKYMLYDHNISCYPSSTETGKNFFGALLSRNYCMTTFVPSACNAVITPKVSVLYSYEK